jgi:3-keto-disaccharide hydrolase
MLRPIPHRRILATLAISVYSVALHANEPVALFDGKTLQGWDVLTCEVEIQDQAILLKGGNGLVQTKKQYGDFVFEFESKALKPDAWDSGVYFRYSKIPEGRPWPDQYQVNLRKGMEGELVGFADGKNKVPVKPGAWNRFELTVKGSIAALKVNGKAAWKVDGIKNASGFIALQAEIPGGGQFLFRNIRIKQLTEERPADGRTGGRPAKN